ncbi:patatin-like phospholipase family protein [Candidatus Arsenophonus nilaparvatae]|uniref:patatin-like phospholipase family protein n=1 Tax=Candidatus Arsenophonus nilaparvatae TaxID=1247023 RepID=UPI0006920C27|nr:patatin-like phospholipase family protein [Candidatus Arsenophonus nilaparvatae]
MGRHISVTLGNIEPLAFEDNAFDLGKIALVCEGGGQRGIFTAGVLDEFLRVGFNPFNIMIGTSAGAQNLSAYLCQQRGYARKVITDYTTKSQFFNPLRFIRGGHMINLDWLIDITSRELPLDFSTGLSYLDSGRQFLISACRYEDFSPVYFQPTQDSWLDIIRASSAIPGFYRQGAVFNGELYHDGGITASIPVEEAYRRGAKTIVVIRTVPSGIYYTSEWLKRMTRWLEHRNIRRMAKMIKVHIKSYQQTQKFIAAPPPGIQIFEIYPPKPLMSCALGSRASTLETDYHIGRQCGSYFLTSLKHYFSNDNLASYPYSIENNQVANPASLSAEIISNQQDEEPKSGDEGLAIDVR